jgi:hypothetical protein
MFSRSLQKDMCPIHICVRELVRVAEAEINVRLCGEVEDGIDVVLAQDTLDICRRGNVTMLKSEVRSVVEDARVVQARTVVELIERDDIVVVGVRQDEMADKPTCSVLVLAFILSPAW